MQNDIFRERRVASALCGLQWCRGGGASGHSASVPYPTLRDFPLGNFLWTNREKRGRGKGEQVENAEGNKEKGKKEDEKCKDKKHHKKLRTFILFIYFFACQFKDTTESFFGSTKKSKFLP